MTASFEVNGSNTTVTFEYTAETAKVQNAVEAAAHYLYDLQADEGSPAFDGLTPQQKLNILNPHVKDVIMDLARAYVSTAAQQTAKETAEDGFDADHELN